MNKFMKSLVCCAAIPFVGFASHAFAVTQYSRVFFFGDSLSDMGNNISGSTDQAPVTNKIWDTNNQQYSIGQTWVDPFLTLLKKNNMLPADADTKVIPSYEIDKNISVTPQDSIDYAFSGDVSGGYNPYDGLHSFHVLVPNDGYDCKSVSINKLPNPVNELCGAQNREHHFVTHLNDILGVNGKLDPDALYVIWVGANDFLQGYGSKFAAYENLVQTSFGPMPKCLTNEPTPNCPKIDFSSKKAQLDAAKLIVSATTNISAMVYELKNHGAKHIVVIDLPNLSYTAAAYDLNLAYALANESEHFNQPDHIVMDSFNQLSTNFNQQLHKKLPSFVTSIPLNNIFNLVREGKITAFKDSTSVNTSLSGGLPTAWISHCCSNQANPTYSPSSCDVNATCSTGGMPMLPMTNSNLPNPEAHYLFFDLIHPTTCAHRYIAHYVASFLPGGPKFNPNENLCTDLVPPIPTKG